MKREVLKMREERETLKKDDSRGFKRGREQTEGSRVLEVWQFELFVATSRGTLKVGWRLFGTGREELIERL